MCGVMFVWKDGGCQGVVPVSVKLVCVFWHGRGCVVCGCFGFEKEMSVCVCIHTVWSRRFIELTFFFVD